MNYDKYSLLKDKKPYFPMMGEFHFSRCPKECWDREIRKMKAGGIDIIATYVFWIHHEEIEGIFDFSGQRDLHTFLELCKKWNIKVFLRIGPWAHGEARNGGFPDWLLKKGWKLRSDDARYLKKVKMFWQRIYEQCSEHMDIVEGIQIENEYGHVGGLRGDEGNQHMRTLTALAKEIGFAAPYWTATGWGGAVIGDLIPVMGGYCDAPWDAAREKLSPNKNYLFTAVRNDGNIGSDVHEGLELSFEKEKYPYLTAELGGGLQVTHHRRPVVCAEDIGAMTLAKIGSGCNLLGYYMYHGGTNPKGVSSSLQESTDAGSFCDVSELSYDFQAPIREYGQISDTLKELKLFAMFVKSFGSDLCRMQPVFDEKVCTDMELSRFRSIVRKNKNSGYLFVNNYQRGYSMKDHKQVSLRVNTGETEICFPVQDIKDKDFFFYPFGFDMGEERLTWINQTPLTILGKNTWIFYGKEPLQFEAEQDLSKAAILAFSKDMAKNLWRVDSVPEVLFLSKAPVIETKTGAAAMVRSGLKSEYYYALTERSEKTDALLDSTWEHTDLPDFLYAAGRTDRLSVYRKKVNIPVCHADCAIEKISEPEGGIKVYRISLDYDHSYNFASEDVFLQISFEADEAELYLNEEKIADRYYTGEVWEVGLGRFGFPAELTLRLKPLSTEDDIYLEAEPQYKNGVCCCLKNVKAETECFMKLV